MQLPAVFSPGALHAAALLLAAAATGVQTAAPQTPPSGLAAMLPAGEGKVLLDNSEPTTKRVLAEEVADNVTDVLRGVLESGTARGRGIDRPAAGKTGTTQENKDAWFIGFTPTLSTSVWMGYENKTVETAKTFGQHPVHGRSSVTGGSFPAQLWQSFMRDALRDVPVTEFSEPAPIEAVPDAVQIR